MFQGSRGVRSGEHFEALMAEGGRLNATTWFDRTNYFETVPTGAVELALWLEADRHGHLLDAVTQENLDNQRDVVKEEKRQRYDNQPYGTALIDVYATVFPEGHPYHHPTIGSMADLDAASLDDVHAFFRAALRPGQHRAHPVRRPHPGARVRARAAVLRRPAAERRPAPPRPPPARAPRPAGAAGPPRGRAQRPAAHRLPSSGRRDRRVHRRVGGDGLHRRPRHLAARQPTGAPRADRPRRRTRPRGGSSTARRSGSSSSTSRRARMPVPSSRPSSRS